METYTEPKELTENPDYPEQREKALSGLTDNMIDKPIVEIVNGFNRLPYCFTLQCCYGHFLFDGQTDTFSTDPLPADEKILRVEYRIAYIAFCIANNVSGKALLDDLKKIPAADPENIQFCCAEWFWKRHLNSYALQVEPDRFKRQDTAVLDYKEALKIENIRNEFFIRLKESLANRPD